MLRQAEFFYFYLFLLHLSRRLSIFTLKCERERCVSWFFLKITDLETALQSAFDFFLICLACLSSLLGYYNISAVHIKILSLLTVFATTSRVMHMGSFHRFTLMLTHTTEVTSYGQQKYKLLQ